MDPIEYDCLNRIRYAIKQYRRWEWGLTTDDYNRADAAEEYLMDLMWDEVVRVPRVIP